MVVIVGDGGVCEKWGYMVDVLPNGVSGCSAVSTACGVAGLLLYCNGLFNGVGGCGVMNL